MSTEGMGALIQHSRVKVLNCSVSGLLLEIDRPLPAGTIARLRVAVGSDEWEDAIQIVWCVPVGGDAESVQHAGARFVSAMADGGSLRHVVRNRIAAVTGCLDTAR